MITNNAYLPKGSWSRRLIGHISLTAITSSCLIVIDVQWSVMVVAMYRKGWTYNLQTYSFQMQNTEVFILKAGMKKFLKGFLRNDNSM